MRQVHSHTGSKPAQNSDMARLWMTSHGAFLLCVRPRLLFHQRKGFAFLAMEGYIDGSAETTWRNRRSEKYLMGVRPFASVDPSFGGA